MYCLLKRISVFIGTPEHERRELQPSDLLQKENKETLYPRAAHPSLRQRIKNFTSWVCCHALVQLITSLTRKSWHLNIPFWTGSGAYSYNLFFRSLPSNDLFVCSWALVYKCLSSSLSLLQCILSPDFYHFALNTSICEYLDFNVLSCLLSIRMVWCLLCSHTIYLQISELFCLFQVAKTIVIL